MIEGVVIRDCIVRADERGDLTELLSVNMGDRNLCHIYKAMARPGVCKAWHLHLGQTDRFVPLAGVAKVGIIDLRGPLFSWHYAQDSRPLDSWVYLASEDPNKLFLDFAAWRALNVGQPVTPQVLDLWWGQSVGEGSQFLAQQTIILDAFRPQLLTIPKGCLHGQQALEGERSELLNCPDGAYCREFPDELRVPADAFECFGWHWGIKDG